MSNTHTLTKTKTFQQQAPIKKIMLTESEDIENTESEKIILSAKHFQTIIETKDKAYEQCYRDAIHAAAKAKAEGIKINLYEMALEKEKREKQEIKDKNSLLENELNIFRSQLKSHPEVEKMTKQKSNRLFIENKETLIDEDCELSFRNEIDELKKRLGVDF